MSFHKSHIYLMFKFLHLRRTQKKIEKERIEIVTFVGYEVEVEKAKSFHC